MDFESLLYLILTEGNNSSIYHIYYLDNDYFIVPEVIHSIPLSIHSVTLGTVSAVRRGFRSFGFRS
jgi:hypothetical protein